MKITWQIYNLVSLSPFRVVIKSIGIFGFFFFLSACLPRPPSPPTSLPVKLSREEILTKIKENLIEINSLKANLETQIEYFQENKLKKSSFEGALLYRQDTAAVRVQALGSWGNTIFDLFYRPEQIMIYLPSSRIVYVGKPEQLINSPLPDLFFFLGELWGGVKIDEGEIFWEDDYNLKTKNKNLEYEITVSSPEFQIEKKQIYYQGEKIMEIAYQDYKKFSKNTLPTKITAFFPQKKTTIKINLISPVINEVLSEQLFNFAPPEKSTWLPLSRLNDFFLYP